MLKSHWIGIQIKINFVFIFQRDYSKVRVIPFYMFKLTNTSVSVIKPVVIG